MAIQVQASVNAGAYAAGKSVVVASDAFQLRLNPQFIAEVWSVRWEIYEAPTGFTTPAGWTADANGLSWYYVATSTTALMPPSVTLGSLWGKYLIRATANAGVLGGVVTTDAVDETCCLVMLSPEGVENIAALEENQSDPRGALAIVKLAIETLVPSNGFETYNVLLYGADPTGVADSTAAIQAAIDAASAAGGGEVFLPPGTYRKPGASAYLVPKSNVTIRGIPGVSIIQLDATGVNPVIRNIVNPFSNFHLRDLVIDGGRTAVAYSNYGSNPECHYGTHITVKGVIVRNCRTLGLGFCDSDDVYVEGCEFLNTNGDGLFCWNTTNFLTVSCSFEGTNDDAISAHTDEAASEPLRANVSILNCSFYRCQGPKILGAKCATVIGNRMRQMLSYGLIIDYSSFWHQGDTVGLSVIVADNVINDVWLRQEPTPKNQEQYYMRIVGVPKDAGGGAAAPGWNDVATGDIVDLFGSGVGNFYSTDVDSGAVPSAGSYSFYVHHNILERTLPACASLADWGYAATMEVGNSGTFSGAIPEAALNTKGIEVVGHLTDALFESNLVRTTGTYSVYFRGEAVAATIADMAYVNVEFRGNTFRDFSSAGMYWPTGGSTVQRIIIRDNLFDGDPRHVHANRGAAKDGTWAANSNPVAIRLGYATGKIVTGNRFRNVCTATQDVPASNNHGRGNVIFCEPLVVGFDATNKGVGTVPYDGGIFDFVIENCDPTSATYGQTINDCLCEASAMPSAGTYVAGHFTRNNTPAIAAGKVVIGWARLTTGSAHVLDTDWAALYCTNA